jgi:hypothetical protein
VRATSAPIAQFGTALGNPTKDRTTRQIGGYARWRAKP